MRKALVVLSWAASFSAIPLVLAHMLALGRSGTNTPFPDVPAWVAVSFAGACALLAAILHRRTRIAVAVAGVAGVLMVLGAATDPAQRALGAETLLGAALCVVAAGLLGLTRQRLGPSSAEVLVDGLIVGLGAWIVVWTVLINPSLAVDGGGLLTTVRAGALALTIVVLFLVATIVFSHDAMTPSLTMLATATILVIAGALLRAIDARIGTGFDQRDWFEATVIASLPIAAASMLHPSIDRLGSPARARRSSPLAARLVTTTAALVAPVVVLALVDPSDGTDRAVRATSVCVLAAAVMARVVQAARSNARAQQHLLRTALTDSLTGLPNRALMIDHVEDALAGAQRTRRQPTVLFIDVDRFKTINDSLGHATGDSVLTHVARRLVESAGPAATVARIAGDEFVVLDPSTESPTQSVVLAERILEAFRDPVATRDGDMFVTASIGVAYAARGVALQAEDLMRHADAAMYRAKDAGRNCIALFDEAMLDRVSARLDIETALYRALERDELRLVHQPIVDVDLGLVVGFEALMRWNRGDDAPVSPAEFIPIAEETGTIVPLGTWALRDALSQLRMWIDAGVCPDSTSMSVNVSPRQLQDPNFVAVVSEAISVAGVRFEQLWIEVTEGVMISEPEQTLGTLRRLHSLGVRIAIDDFGTGYSSLSLLQQFPVQCIKIDRSFVTALVHSPETRSIVRTIMAMAETLGAEIVAEGVEDAAQLAALRSLKCSRVQGYLVGRPLPAAHIPAAVEAIQDPDSLRTLLSPTPAASARSTDLGK